MNLIYDIMPRKDDLIENQKSPERWAVHMSYTIYYLKT